MSTIPAALRDRRRWLLWRYDGDVKVPLGKTDDPDTWITFTDAQKKFQPKQHAGLGYVFYRQDGYCGIDLDGCRNPATGELAGWAKGWVERFNTYTEISPSGTGVKLWCVGRNPLDKGKNTKIAEEKVSEKEPGVEIYDQLRYFAVTGQHLDGTPTTLEPRQDVINEFCRTYWPTPETTNGKRQQRDRGTGDNTVDRAAKYLAKIPPAISGQGGHKQTFHAACVLVLGFDLTPEQAYPLLAEWNAGCQPPWSEHELRHKLEDAAKQPGERGYLLNAERDPPPNGKPRTTRPTILRPDQRTEIAIARRFREAFGDRVRYVATWQDWLVWDGKRWRQDSACVVEALASQAIQSLWDELAAAGKVASEDTAKQIFRFVSGSQKKRVVFDALTLMRSKVAVDVERLDSDPWLFNVANGTVDLRTSKLRPHDPADVLTKISPASYNLDAECPQWRAFLGEVFESAELVRYIQQLAGYSLTGEVTEHVLAFLYGTGSNGKSTLVETLLHVFGEYGMKANADLLLAKNHETHPTERADLHGKRLVACVEADAGRRLAEALVKELTGGDRIRARRMRENFWEFRPSHTTWLAANHRPVVRGTDDGIWRRIKLVPFLKQWDTDGSRPDLREADKGLQARLFAEADGILMWCLEGLQDWQQRGLTTPKAVLDATRQYRHDSDSIGQFIDDCCIVEPELTESATALYKAYVAWRGDSRRAITQTAFGKELESRGFAKERLGGSGKVLRRGLALVDREDS